MEKIVAKVMKKLAEERENSVFIKRIDYVYKKHKHTKFEDPGFPKDLLQTVGDLMDSFHPDQKDKLEILKELKKKHFFNLTLV